jgi:hypothetical protein
VAPETAFGLETSTKLEMFSLEPILYHGLIMALSAQFLISCQEEQAKSCCVYVTDAGYFFKNAMSDVPAEFSRL